MVDRNILALHDRIDEEHFDVHLLKSAVRALQEQVSLLEAEVRELRRAQFESVNEANDGHRKTSPAGGPVFHRQSK